ncbi:hypothetical protein [Shinella sp.]|uniref:hypothetical protein n=1 Tax=unclassified Shinella TaxID=2643062 RepID=UPI0028AD7CA0|nr:hypothetical protein [Shinella sp.]
MNPHKSAKGSKDPRLDAAGQYAPLQADRSADGVASAKPTVVTGSEDATAHRDPPGKKRQKDWDVGFDDRQPDRS